MIFVSAEASVNGSILDASAREFVTINVLVSYCSEPALLASVRQNASSLLLMWSYCLINGLNNSITILKKLWMTHKLNSFVRMQKYFTQHKVSLLKLKMED